jgi:hypothetical protein
MHPALLCLALTAGTGPLEEKTFAALHRELVPTAAEQKWLRIPWHVTLWDAIVAAQKEDKPILFYAMNGHPLTVC